MMGKKNLCRILLINTELIKSAVQSALDHLNLIVV